MAIPTKALDLIKQFEGFQATSYICPAGVLTVGYGTTGKGVTKGMTVTEAQATQLLMRDVARFETAVDRLVKVPLTANERGALVCFTYNLGEGTFGSSTMLKLLNANKFDEAADQFPRFNKAGGRVLAGLTRRRAAERALFMDR